MPFNLNIEDSLLSQYYFMYDKVPPKWTEEFGELNWLGPTCPRVHVGFGGKVYTCTLYLDEPSFPSFDLNEILVRIEEYGSVDNQISCIQIRTIGYWHDTKGNVLKFIINRIIGDFLKEHEEHYYK